MPIAKRRFRPRLAPTLAVVLLLPVLAGLGLWQLDRAEQKRALEALYAARLQAPLLDLNASAPLDPESLRYRRARARGEYDARYALLLDNQVQRGRAGFDVLTPLHLAGSDRYVLVDRGWVPLGPSRAQPPTLALPEGRVEVEGLLVRPVRPFTLGAVETAPSAGAVSIVQYVDLAAIAAATGYEFLPLVLEVRDGAAAPPLLAMPASRHTGYAVQWFALAAALIVLYLVVSFRKVEHERH